MDVVSNYKRFFPAVILLLCSLSNVVAQPSSKTGKEPQATKVKPTRLTLMPCRRPELDEEVRCGKYEVFENRQSGRGRKIALSVLLLPAKETPAASDPLFFLAGGPGQGATKLADFAAEHFTEIRRRREIVLVDQRGTGESNPLRCALWAEDPLGYFGELLPLEAVRACRAKLEKQADLSLYTTQIAMDDLDEVREALGYQQINIYGTSYGTRAALAYTRQHPAHVRSVILKGITPMGLTIPLPFAKDTQRALDLLFADCAADEKCHTAFPRLTEDFQTLMRALRQGKVVVEAEHPTTGKTLKLTVAPGVLTSTLRSILQSTSASTQVPLMIQQAALGDYSLLVKSVMQVRRGLSEELNYGMFLTVTGTEDTPFISPDSIARETKDTFMGDYWVRQLIEATKAWPRGKLPRDFNRPVTANVPALLLSGFLDPATPPRWGEEAASHLSQSLHVVIRNASHSYGGLAPCVDRLMAEFIERGSAKGLNTACTNDVRRPPFVLSQAEIKP